MRGALFYFSLIVCLASVGYSLFSVWCAAAFFSSEKRAPPDGETPSVTVLKSVCGVDAGTHENLASFCRQDYPEFQILFGVEDRDDPVVRLIGRLKEEFPAADIEWVLCDRRTGQNPKVSNLIPLEEKTKHPLLLVSDGDIRVDRQFLRRMVRPMRDPGVGAVTCMCRSLSKGWIGTLEAIRESTEFCPQVLVAEKLEGIRFGLGSGILLRKAALEKIGGFASIADVLADDFCLGNRIAQAGYAVRLSPEVVEHDLSITDLRVLLRRQIRWNRGIRACRPWGYRGLLLTYGIPISLLLLPASGFSAAGWAVFAATWTARLAAARIIGGGFLSDRAARRYPWLAPAQDLLSFPVWCAGLFGNRIQWRGRSFRLTMEGKLLPSDAHASLLPINSALARPLAPFFVKAGVSANAVTFLSLLSGAAGGVFFSFGPPGMLAGALGFLLANLFDECDGKVARLTGTASALGAFLDTVADCVVHIALFLGLGLGLHRQFPGGPFLFLGGVAAAGSFLSFAMDVGGLTPWQAPGPSAGREDSLTWVTEWLRIDFSLLVVLSALLGRLEWIVWAGALGVFIFWIPSTVLITLRSRKLTR